MSYEIGINTIKLHPGNRLAHTEYCDHYDLVRTVTGLDPLKDATAWQKFNDAWDLDFIWSTYEGVDGWGKKGRTTDMGHAEFMEGGIDRREPVACPFKTVDEHQYQSGHATYPNQVLTGGHYDTIVSGGIQAFGWDMFLAAAADQRRFDKVLESIYQVTLHSVKAWAKTSIEVFIQHDEAIFPRYKLLWQVLHDAGKIVLFCSDGNFTRFVDDIAQAGADGFIFEPLTDLDYIAQKYGKTKVIIGSKLDCRTLTFGNRDQIKAEVDETLKIAIECPGFFFAVGNHLPSNIPLDNALFFYDYLSHHWNR